jgi:hypothetical protein
MDKLQGDHFARSGATCRSGFRLARGHLIPNTYEFSDRGHLVISAAILGPPSSRGPGHRPLTAATGVRIPLGVLGSRHWPLRWLRLFSSLNAAASNCNNLFRGVSLPARRLLRATSGIALQYISDAEQRRGSQQKPKHLPKCYSPAQLCDNGKRRNPQSA